MLPSSSWGVGFSLSCSFRIAGTLPASRNKSIRTSTVGHDASGNKADTTIHPFLPQTAPAVLLHPKSGHPSPWPPLQEYCTLSPVEGLPQIPYSVEFAQVYFGLLGMLQPGKPFLLSLSTNASMAKNPKPERRLSQHPLDGPCGVRVLKAP